MSSNKVNANGTMTDNTVTKQMANVSLDDISAQNGDVDANNNNNNNNNDHDHDHDHEGATDSSAYEGEEFGGKHPLQNHWVLWYDKRQVQSRKPANEKVAAYYESNLQEIGDMQWVEDFWAYYNHIKKPSQIPMNSNYHFFKHGIKPMWEDPANKNGGKWIMQFKGNNKENVDEVWEKLLLAMVGEYLDIDDELCGAVFSRRKAGDKIAVWTRNKNNIDAIKDIGKKIREVCQVSKGIRLEYQHHEDAMATGLSYKNESKLVL